MTELAKLEIILKHAEQISNDIDQLNKGTIDYFVEINKLLEKQSEVIISIKNLIKIAEKWNL